MNASAGTESIPDKRDELDSRTLVIIGAAIEVHRALGPGLLESAYQSCLAHELSQRGLSLCQQVPLPVRYKGVHLDCGCRLDLIVEDEIIVEVKSVDELVPIHGAAYLVSASLRKTRRSADQLQPACCEARPETDRA